MLDGVGVASERQRTSVHSALCQVRPVESVYNDERFVRELRRRVSDHQVTDQPSVAVLTRRHFSPIDSNPHTETGCEKETQNIAQS